MCIIENCKGIPTYNYKDQKAKFCAIHRLPNMINTIKKMCIEKECYSAAQYGIDKNNILYCAKHKKEGTIDQKHKKCQHKDCLKIPAFNYKNSNIGIYCFDHKLEDMVNVKSNICQFCKLQATFGYQGDKIATRCKDHKKIDMIDIKHKKCAFENCNKIPNYGYENQKGIYCKDHKKDNMIDVKHKKCAFENCNVRPCYNFIGMKPKFCVAHKENDMIDLTKNKNKILCLHCSKYAKYGLQNNEPEYCKEHKKDKMINLIDKICIHENCDKTANFGYGKPEYCSLHKKNDMLNIKTKKCTQCNNTAKFCVQGEKPTCCEQHKTKDMILYIRNICQLCDKKANYGVLFGKLIHCKEHKQKNEFERHYILPKCINDNCKNNALYTDKSTNYPLRCENHKIKNDINIVEKKCSKCELMNFIRNDHNLCDNCHDFFIKKIHKNKELEIKNLLVDNNISFQSHDKISDNSCFKYRPDFIIDYGLFFVILEVDENQHSSYDCLCEQTRMINIYQDFGGIPIIFVRYNPDQYKNNHGKIIKSNSNRHKILLEFLNGLKNKTIWSLPLSVIYFFYDGFDVNEKKYYQ